jgi:hypothetical protein
MEFELIELDDRARRYIIDKLTPPYPLSQAFVERFGTHRGRIFSVWPKESSHDRIYGFTGAVFAPPQQFSRSHAENWFVDYVRDFLRGERNRLVVVEDWCSSKGRPSTLDQGINKVFSGDGDYHVLFAQHNDRKSVAHLANQVVASWRGWMLFSSLPDEIELKDGGELDIGTINTLIDRAVMCAIGAYDFESYLMWEL